MKKLIAILLIATVACSVIEGINLNQFINKIRSSLKDKTASVFSILNKNKIKNIIKNITVTKCGRWNTRSLC